MPRSQQHSTLLCTVALAITVPTVVGNGKKRQRFQISSSVEQGRTIKERILAQYKWPGGNSPAKSQAVEKESSQKLKKDPLQKDVDQQFGSDNPSLAPSSSITTDKPTQPLHYPTKINNDKGTESTYEDSTPLKAKNGTPSPVLSTPPMTTDIPSKFIIDATVNLPVQDKALPSDYPSLHKTSYLYKGDKDGGDVVSETASNRPSNILSIVPSSAATENQILDQLQEEVKSNNATNDKSPVSIAPAIETTDERQDPDQLNKAINNQNEKSETLSDSPSVVPSVLPSAADIPDQIVDPQQKSTMPANTIRDKVVVTMTPSDKPSAIPSALPSLTTVPKNTLGRKDIPAKLTIPISQPHKNSTVKPTLFEAAILPSDYPSLVSSLSPSLLLSDFTSKPTRESDRIEISSSFTVTIDRPFFESPYCQKAGKSSGKTLDTCKANDTSFVEAKIKADWNSKTARTVQNAQDLLTGECGPHCRPTCVTLMLDIDRLYYDSMQCNVSQVCDCNHSRNNSCKTNERQKLLDRHHLCYLEEAKCLGPIVYDDTVTYNNFVASQSGIQLPIQTHCSSVPANFTRFQNHQIIQPMQSPPDCNDCLKSDRKLYFEYCHTLHEECNDCTKCSNDDYQTFAEPISDGWTSFVVSASIPYLPGYNPTCDASLQYSSKTNAACFMQRVDLYYPPAMQQHACPQCHACPLLQLGDTIGPLEVVGFGSCLNESSPCAPCNKRQKKLNTCNNCNTFQCQDLSNCMTGESLGVADFVSNNCSYRLDWTANATTVGSTITNFTPLDRTKHVAGIQNKGYTDNSKSSIFDIRGIAVVLAIQIILIGAIMAVIKFRRSTRRFDDSQHGRLMLSENSVFSNDNNNNSNKSKPVLHVVNSATLVDAPENDGIEAVHFVVSSRL